MANDDNKVRKNIYYLLYVCHAADRRRAHSSFEWNALGTYFCLVVQSSVCGQANTYVYYSFLARTNTCTQRMFHKCAISESVRGCLFITTACSKNTAQ